MTQEEKLEEAKRLYETANADQRYVLESLFPELKESEDEGICRKLIAFLRQCRAVYGDGFKQFGLDIDDALAWLEKQGNLMKALQISNARIGELIEENYYLREQLEKQGENTYNKVLSELLHKVICRYINDPDIPYFDREKVSMEVLPYVERLEKQGEQEPKFRIGDTIKKKSTGDIVTVSEVDLKNREYRLSNTGFIPFKYEYLWELVEQKPVFEMITPEESLGIDSDTYNKIVDECVYGEQKSAWSEEDELNIRELESIVKQVWATAEHGNDKDTIHKMSNLSFFLKTLKPQLKQEWSKEDEILLKLSLENLTELKDRFGEYYGRVGGCIDWLKSLKDRVQPQNRWKPSDEQMDALHYVTNFDYGGHKATLVSLYEQLKKLK